MTVPYLGCSQTVTEIPTDQIPTLVHPYLCRLPLPLLDLDATIRIADVVAAAGIVPEDGQEEVQGGDDNGEDEGFITVEDVNQGAGDTVIVSVTAADVQQTPAARAPGGPSQLFESDDEESDVHLGDEVEAILAEGGPLEVPVVVDTEEQLAEGNHSSDDDDDDDEDEDNADVTHDYYADQEPPPKEDSSETPKKSALQDLLAGKKPADILENPGTAHASNPPIDTDKGKGKGPSSGTSGKAPAPKLPTNPGAPGAGDTTTGSFSEATKGVQARAEETLFGAIRLSQPTTGEDQMVHNLENYTGLLTGLQQLVMVMAQGYQNASEDVRELVSTTLARATERDREFIQKAFAALGEWTRAYQAAVGSHTNLPMFDLLQRWDQVRAAGNRLADEILSLTATEMETGSSAEILRALIPACFSRVRARSEAVFRTMNAELPSLLCRFVSGEQAGQMLASICTTMCNYNIEMCGMALSQTVVPVYAIPTTYDTQRSLWQSICQIIPGIAQQTGSDLRPFGPRAPRNTPFDTVTVPNSPAGNSGDPGATASSSNPGISQRAQIPVSTGSTASLPPAGPTGVPFGIPPAGCVMMPKSAFATAPTVDLSKDDGNSGAGLIGAPQQTSTPIKQRHPSDRSASGRKMDVSKIQAAHLINELSDRREEHQRGGSSPSSSRDAVVGRGPGGSLPPGLPAQAPGLAASGVAGSMPGRAKEVPCLSQQVPKAKLVVPVECPTPQKCHAPADDDATADIEEVGEVSAPPKKKKKKKDKNRENGTSKDTGDSVEPSTSGVTKSEEKPEVSETLKKKKKKKKEKSARDKFEEERRIQIARQLAFDPSPGNSACSGFSQRP